jgi:hypothetical protein
MGLLAEYKRGLKSVAVEEMFDLVFYRPLAFLLVKLIYRTAVTPNQLTLLSMVFGVLGGVSLALGTPLALSAGAVLFLLYNIVDCSDGQLARINHSGTHLGRILDGFADYVVSLAAYLGIGIGYASASDEPLLMWGLTAAAGISNAAQSGLLDFYRNRFLDATGVRTSVLVEEQNAFREEYGRLRLREGKRLEKLLIGAYLLYSRVQDRLTGGRGKIAGAPTADPAEYVRANRTLMRFWTFLGPTTQWTLLVVCAFAGRLDIYLWGIAGAGNILAVIMILAQRWSKGHVALQEG